MSSAHRWYYLICIKSNDAIPKKKKLLKEIYELIKVARYRINPEEKHYISILQ